jgi:FMN phosphatase YigB (HAD superfamily)
MALAGLLFDAGDVIYHRPRRGVAIAALLAPHGLTLIPRKDPQVIALHRASHRGLIAREEYFKQRLQLSGVRDASVIAEGARIMAGVQGDIELFDGVVDTLHTLKNRGLKLGIVTNTHDTEAEKRVWFTRFGIANLWDSWASSCELGALKPEAAIYHAALTPLGVAANRVAFVAHAAKELEGAAAIGLRTISFNRDDDTVCADAHAEKFADLLNLVDTLA